MFKAQHFSFYQWFQGHLRGVPILLNQWCNLRWWFPQVHGQVILPVPVPNGVPWHGSWPSSCPRHTWKLNFRHVGIWSYLYVDGWNLANQLIWYVYNMFYIRLCLIVYLIHFHSMPKRVHFKSECKYSEFAQVLNYSSVLSQNLPINSMHGV